MEYLSVHDWEEWQSYRKDRGQPPWIKVHREMMRKPKWVVLPDEERGQLIAIWILAADENGKIPADADMIKKQCYMTKTPNLKKFIELNWLDANVTPSGCHDDANTTPTRRQHDALETETETEKNREEKKQKYRESVFLTERQYKKLEEEHGVELTVWAIEILDNYKMSHGKKYKSDYHTLRGWPMEEARKKKGPTSDKANDPWRCRGCGKKADSIMGGLCPECKEKKL